jgi:hypothetical protein
MASLSVGVRANDLTRKVYDNQLGSEQNCCAILDLTRKVNIRHPTIG